MKRFNLMILSLALASMFVSCNYLDIDQYFSDEIKIDSVFSNTRNVEAYIWGIASEFKDEGSYLQNADTPGTYATDECFTMNATSSGYWGLALVLNEINASQVRTMGDVWTNSYQAIRRANTVFARIDEAWDLEPQKRAELLALTRFMRAYAYYKMWLNFGPVILLGDEEVASNLELEEYDRARATNDETVEYICAELEEAAKYLPLTRPLSEFGRPTKGAAYGLIARIRLYHASPLWNGGEVARRCFGNWYRSTDGVRYVNMDYDESRWAVAAAAAKRVMEMTNGGAKMYKLYTTSSTTDSAKYTWSDGTTQYLPEGISDPNYYEQWPLGAAGIDHLKSYSEGFTGEAVLATNPEFVWGLKSNTLRDNTRMCFPIKNGGWCATALTQKMIDGFRMVDGRTISESSEQYPYSEEGFTTSSKKFSGYQLNSNVYNMYVNREMRFYATVGFSERYWTMTSATTSGKYNQTITYYYDSTNGKQNSAVDYTPTGYILTKFIHPEDAWDGDNARRMDKAYGIVRYADILLMYAEALNHLTTTHEVTLGDQVYTLSRDTEEMRAAFNQIRYRAGLPGVTDAELATEDSFEPVLRQERMIELLCENHRYFDVRRWGIYEDEE
ncbi:MAG: RagB/SusD family nutrient uptake outer membrane protein, partial [Alistipes sp.]|nr:RagB/SusD family nutrient uptake outer membrane protein [Alistipes sp.]